MHPIADAQKGGERVNSSINVHEPELAAITGLRLDKVVAPDKGFGAGRVFGRVDPAERHNHDTGRTASACPLAGPFLLALGSAMKEAGN